MLEEDRYFNTLSEPELWNRYCGFFDLSIEEFMEIQEKLLVEEIDLVADSILGKKIMGERKPASIDEFRETIPLTTYDDYEPYLSEKQENALAVKPHLWCHSSGQQGRFKWIPHSRTIVEKAIQSYLAGAILSSCRRKGEVRIYPGMRILAVLAPPPYASGEMFRALSHQFSVHIMPPLDVVEGEFMDRVRLGFKMALRDGMDYVGSIASVMARMGEAFAEQSGGTKLSASMLHPAVISRFVRAYFRAKIGNRPILPKDIWQPKGILVSGVDTAIYKEKTAYYWGIEPIELYGGTEAHTYALQGWNRKGLTFLPDRVFLEFIPYHEELEHEDTRPNRPRTVLFNELKKGKLYEIIITQLYGMPLLRYRLNDIIIVTSIGDEELGITLPQISFHHRVGEVINLGGLVWLDEKTIWQSIYDTGINFTEWAACKEYTENRTFLRIYIELKEELDANTIEEMIDRQLRSIDTNYWEIKETFNMNPVKVTLLPTDTFQLFVEEKRRLGADLAHLKPAHVNPSDKDIKLLLKFGGLSD